MAIASVYQFRVAGQNNSLAFMSTTCYSICSMTRKKQPGLLAFRWLFPQARFSISIKRLGLHRRCAQPKAARGLSPYAEALTRFNERLKQCGGNLKKMMDGDPKWQRPWQRCVSPAGCGNRKQPTAYLVPQPSWRQIKKRN